MTTMFTGVVDLPATEPLSRGVVRMTPAREVASVNKTSPAVADSDPGDGGGTNPRMKEQDMTEEPIRPVTHKDGSLITPVSQALRKASKRAGWNRDKDRWVNPVLDRLEQVSKRWR